VSLHLDAPEPTGGRSPVVAILDTGLGSHPWFDGSPLVDRDPRVDGVPIGLRFSPADDPEATGATVDDVNRALDPLAGHGTFVAGVVRQHCPDARLVIVPVMYGDGAADEKDVLDALNALALYHWGALDGLVKGDPLDVLNLSFGYYPETPGAVTGQSSLLRVLRELADSGVAVLAAAGNGATTERFYPAAMADEGPTPTVPVTSVGARNPDGRTVAIFSNTGPWVTAYDVGVAVVSTMPVTFDASLRSGIEVPGGSGRPERGNPDPDGYRSGFGVWSGTSFSCPACAGDVAGALAAGASPAEALEAAVGRGS
jgi:subtilisin family serine protease